MVDLIALLGADRNDRDGSALVDRNKIKQRVPVAELVAQLDRDPPDGRALGFGHNLAAKRSEAVLAERGAAPAARR